MRGCEILFTSRSQIPFDIALTRPHKTRLIRRIIPPLSPPFFLFPECEIHRRPFFPFQFFVARRRIVENARRRFTCPAGRLEKRKPLILRACTTRRARHYAACQPSITQTHDNLAERVSPRRRHSSGIALSHGDA